MIYHRSAHRNQRGFTLTEILVAVAIFAIIFVAALMIYDQSNRVFTSSMAQGDMQQNTRVAFENVTAELRMAGFDFDRDGTPTGSNVYQQPDEQLEYVGDHAITFRSNTDYETDAANDNGREPDYEPPGGEIPFVTTGNDEIITYALVSDDASANTDTISFFADVARPRQTFPGGNSETQVDITGVDLCDNGGGCVNPPYTLYRITLDDSGNPVRSPVASDIRTFDLTYFTDALSLSTLNPAGVDGAGQYQISGNDIVLDAAALAARAARERVQSIGVRIVGMSENPDPNWQDPLETGLDADATLDKVPSAVEHRQYELTTTIVPRNLGRRGMQEFSTRPPSSPHLTSICAEGCGVIRLEWDAPDFGTVDSYHIVYDTTSATGSFASVQTFDAGQNLYGYTYGLDPGQEYWFKVVAKNAFGSTRSNNALPSASPGMYPINWTKPKPPVMTGATGDGTIAAIENDITIYFDVQRENVAGSVNSCTDNAVDVPFIEELTESSGFEIYRSTVGTFAVGDPGVVKVWDGWLKDNLANEPTVSTDYKVTFTDTTAKIPCEEYHYKVIQKEICSLDPAHSRDNDTTYSVSDLSDPIMGSATSTVAPAPPNTPIFNSAVCYPALGYCDFDIQWDAVVTDTAGNSIQVADYTVHRFTAPGGVEDSTTEVTFSVTDSDPTDATVSTGLFTAPYPGLNNLYHFYVSASTCSGANQGAMSTPALKYPCSTMTLTAGPSPAPLDGSGQSSGSPYLIDSTTASVDYSLGTDIIYNAQIALYVGDTTTTVAGGSVSYTSGVSTTASFSIPLTSTVVRAEMTLTDANSCSNTKVLYFQEAFGACCLIPDDLQASVITVVSNGNDSVATVVFENQCFQNIVLTELDIAWNTANNGLQGLVKILYPDGTTQDFSAAPLTTSPQTIAIPAAVDGTIAPGTTFTVKITFQRKNNADETMITNLCATYDLNATPVECSVKSSGLNCP